MPVSVTRNTTHSRSFASSRLRRDRHHAALGKLHGIADEVQQRLADPGLVRTHHAEVVGAAHFDAVAVLLGGGAERRGHVADQRRDRERLDLQFHLPGLDLGQVEDLVDQCEQVAAGAQDPLQRFDLFALAEVARILQQHLADADDRVQRRAQFVAHVGEELRLVPAGRLELAALVLDLLEQAGVLDREHRLRGEGLEQPDHRGRELAGIAPADDQRAEDAILAQQRDADQRTEAAAAQQIVEAVLLVPIEIRDLHGMPLRRAPTDHRVAEPDVRISQRGDHVFAEAVVRLRHEDFVGRVIDIDRAGVRPRQFDRVGDDGGQHRLQIERRVHGLADLAERLHLGDRARQFLGPGRHLVLEIPVRFPPAAAPRCG